MGVNKDSGQLNLLQIAGVESEGAILFKFFEGISMRFGLACLDMPLRSESRFDDVLDEHDLEGIAFSGNGPVDVAYCACG